MDSKIPDPTEVKPTEAGKEPPKAGDPAPLDIAKLILPEGMDAKDPALGQFAELAGTAKLDQATAQKFMDLYTSEVKKSVDAGTQAWSALNAQWTEAVQKDPDIGGANLPNVQSTISKAFDQYGTPGLKEALNMTGAGNNPDVIKTLYNMAKKLTEGSPTQGTPPAAASGDLASIMYPNLKRG